MRKSSCVLLLLAAAALAQTGADKPTAVAGTVTNALTGEPILRAHVAVRGSTAEGQQVRYGAVTDAAGKFSITGMPPGSYSAQAERVGFAAGVAAGAGVGFKLQAGDSRSDIRIQLAPLGAVSGRIVNPDSEPVAWIRVSVETPNGAVAAAGTADERGVYRIGGLRPGQYRIKAAPQAVYQNMAPEVRSDGSEEPHYIATWHPGATSAKAGVRIAVQPGAETTGIDIRLARGPIVRVSGVVRDIPPAARPNVELRSGGAWFTVPQVGADGSFSIWRLDPGSYTIRASCTSGGKLLVSAPLDIEVGGVNLDHVDLRLVPPGDLTGTVEYEGDEIRSNTSTTPVRHLALEDVDHRVSVPPAEISASDTFKIDGVPAGRYRIRITPPPAYVKSVRLGPAAAEGNILDLRNGAGGAPVALVLSAATGSIAGDVTADRPAAARVALIPEDPESGLSGSLAAVAASGAYAIESVRPGRYKLIALDPNDPRSLDDFEDQVEHIEVTPRDRLMQDLTVPQSTVGMRK